MRRYIDADALIRSIQTERGCLGYSLSASKFASIIREQPTADVRENVKGKWIVSADDDGDPSHGYKKCSVCGWGTHLDGYYMDNYCPYCGSDMRKE